MANYVDNRLAISVPTERAVELLAALEGPAQWPVPDGLLPTFGRESSQHERIRIAAKIADGSALSGLEAKRVRLGWPSWMKPTRKDIETIAAGQAPEAPDTVTLSFPRLAPWTGPEEFARYFPDATPDDPVHTPVETPRGFNLRDFHQARMGTGRTPGGFELALHEDGDRTTIEIRFTTAWSPVERIAPLLGETLKARGARCLYTWVEEQGYCGYTFLDPETGSLQSEDFDAGNRWQVEEAFEDDPEETYLVFDRAAFEAEIADIVADAHL